MKKLIIFSNGTQSVNDSNIRVSVTGAAVEQEIDVTHATPEEIESLKKNPNQKGLIDLINKRG